MSLGSEFLAYGYNLSKESALKMFSVTSLAAVGGDVDALSRNRGYDEIKWNWM